MDNHVTTQLMGGLGNQLFQIAHLIAYCKRFKKHFCLPDRLLEGNRAKTYWDNFFKSLCPFLVSKDTVNVFRRVHEPHFEYSAFPDCGGGIMFFGYFQSWRYFEEYKKDIFEILDIENVQKQIFADFDFTDTISLHFRIGDYKNVTHVHPILPIEYYLHALNVFEGYQTKFRVLYFYEVEDEMLVNEMINVLQKKYPGFVFIPCIERLDDWEQMIVMSRCTHHIIANSSFSWWGAYLGNKENDITVYPCQWFGVGHDTKDLCPTRWKKIQF